MLKRIRVQNFKAWQDTGEVRLAPLTVLFGANSAGKSSLGQLLLALKQTAASLERNQVLHVGDENSLIELGSFTDCLHGRNPATTLGFMLDWQLTSPLSVSEFAGDTSFGDVHAVGNFLQLTSRLVADQNKQPALKYLEYVLHSDTLPEVVRATLDVWDNGGVTFECTPLALTPYSDRAWPIEVPEKFYRFTDRTVARYSNARFLLDFAYEAEQMLDSIRHLGPLRDYPRRLYSWHGSAPSDVGTRGEFTIPCLLAAGEDGRRLSAHANSDGVVFQEFIANCLLNLGAIEHFSLKPIAPGRREYEVWVRTHGGLVNVALPDVGFGVSQILPALIQAFYCAPGSTIWLEQPEIHLHPQIQSGLADVFIAAVRAYQDGIPRNTQLIIETHSEHFLNRLQRRVAEGGITRDELAIHFVRSGNEGAELEELVVNEYGDIANWPDNFFGDEMEDIVARSRAAALRRQNNSGTEKRGDGNGHTEARFPL